MYGIGDITGARPIVWDHIYSTVVLEIVALNKAFILGLCPLSRPVHSNDIVGN